jgi:hypothetical protein
MAGRQQTAPPKQRHSKDTTVHPHQPGVHTTQTLHTPTQPQPQSPSSQNQGQIPITEQNFPSQQVQTLRSHEHVVLFCNTLDQHGVKTKKFFKRAGFAAQTGTTLHLSPHSLWSPPNSGPARFALTLMSMLIPTLMTMLQQLLHQMIVNEFLLDLWGAVQGLFFSSCFLWLHTWRSCHSQLLFATRTRVLKSASLG